MSLAERILNGEIRAMARLISLVENNAHEAIDEMKALYPKTGRAYVIGVTGAPGAGKSTLVDKLISHIRAKGLTVGIIAVDPTSPFSGGAILGDRIRMQQHSTDEGVFIRSMATRGALGGLSMATSDSISVMDSFGKDVVLVETVGVGQDEVDIVKTAHTTVIISVPGLGDEIQAIKAGILEIGDVFVVNKADREGAEETVRELEVMLNMRTRGAGWDPTIFKTVAYKDEGIAELVDGIFKHKEYLVTSKTLDTQKRIQSEAHLIDVLKERVTRRIIDKIGGKKAFDEYIHRVATRDTDPYSAVEEMIHKAGINA